MYQGTGRSKKGVYIRVLYKSETTYIRYIDEYIAYTDVVSLV